MTAPTNTPPLRRRAALVACLLAAACVADEPPPELAEPTSILDDVDVFTGTSSLGFGVGSAFPGPALPFGMARPGPDTQGESSTLWSLHCSGYRHSDPFISGFSSMRLHGTGIPDYGMLALQPVVSWSPDKRSQRGHRLRKDAATETASPGRYAVSLETERGPIGVELTATKRVALHRYTLPTDAGSGAGLVLDLSHMLPDNTFHEGDFVDVAGDGSEWQGFVRFSGAYSGRHGGETAWFVVQFDRAPTDTETWSMTDDADGDSVGDGLLGAFLQFDPASGPVQAKVAISFVDTDGARNNLEEEAPGWDFAATADAARAAWDEALSSFAIGDLPPSATNGDPAGSDGVGPDTVARANFASSAYHAMLMPTLFTDVDGRYRGFDSAVHTASDWTYYTDFSLWDTYRTQHPLMNLIDPDRQVDFVRSLLTMGEQGGGEVPRWPVGTGHTHGMLGDPADIVAAGMLIRGIGHDVLDPQAVLDQLVASAEAHRDRWDEWEARGWLAADLGGDSVSETLEFAWADAALAELAESIGDPRAAELRARSQGYRNLWDEETGFLRPRRDDGSFEPGFDPESNSDAFVEGNAWHYTWMAPHDADALIELFGGNEAFVDKLDHFFMMATFDPEFTWPSTFYWHGNEPDLHSAWMFAQAGRPDLTRKWTRWIEDERYFPGPDGLPGNDDAGTLAAWYVFSAAGLYPIAGTTTYVLGTPRFEVVRLRAGSGWLTLRAPGLRTAVDPTQVARVLVNGEEWTAPTVDWSTIEGGADIVFEFAE